MDIPGSAHTLARPPPKQTGWWIDNQDVIVLFNCNTHMTCKPQRFNSAVLLVIMMPSGCRLWKYLLAKIVLPVNVIIAVICVHVFLPFLFWDLVIHTAQAAIVFSTGPFATLTKLRSCKRPLNFERIGPIHLTILLHRPTETCVHGWNSTSWFFVTFKQSSYGSRYWLHAPSLIKKSEHLARTQIMLHPDGGFAERRWSNSKMWYIWEQSFSPVSKESLSCGSYTGNDISFQEND